MLPFPARRPIKAYAIVLMLLLAASTFASRPAHAASDLNLELAEMAKKIKLLLDQKGVDAIAVGDFTAPAKLAASAGPAIAKCLADELKTLGVTVKRRAELEVNGRYQDVDDKDTKLLAVQIKAHVVDHTGDEIMTLEPRAIFNITTIASLTGVTVAMPADGTDKERNEALADALDKPEVHLASTRISAAADSPYAVEIQVKSAEGYRPRAASKDDDGLAFLKILRSEIYAIKLINDSPYDAAVTVTIDGLNIFAFSDHKNYTHYIVPSKQALVVPGWHRTNQVSDSFQVTEYAKSAVAEALPSSTTVGTITASFAAAWAKDSVPPDDEAPGKKGGRNGNATGKGPPVDFKLVEVVRDIGRLRASVSVRYNKDEDPKDLPGGKP
ncbi:hypothetical protein SAMN05444166_4371 [Singulisphaera sp. GP187]|uniref:hypothetical protein n=1 Tax=Singulisphaera sp. GP187 TaxID=1882752 RepID=UPI000929FF56|nr:hypothetical protein [Singulisphaera sp. GP187]SIO39846.1 hypothetical protein SAMN05444166_4371 [Singulisphaera sp. GP187]